MDKDKKLEQFFKNRVNDFDAANDDWDKPDASVFQNAQVHFPKHPKPIERDWKNIVMVLLALLLLSLLGGLFFMKKNMTALEEKLHVAETSLQSANFDIEKNKLQEVNNQLATVEKKCTEVTTELLKQAQSASLSLETLSSKNQQLQKNITLQNNRIESLLVENQMLTKDVTATVQGLTSSQAVNSKIQNKNDGLTESQTAMGKLPSRTILFFPKRKTPFYLRRDVGTDPLELVPPKSRHKKFEIGVNYTLVTENIFNAYKVGKVESLSGGEGIAVNRMHGMTVNLGYKINPRLWLNTGFRKSGGFIEQGLSTELKYDKDSEYLDSEGKTINDFEINTETSYSDAGNQIDFEVPSGLVISDEEKVFAKWEESQEIQSIHIPIGLTYFSPFSRGSQLEWFLKGGLGWNQVTYGKYDLDANVFYKEELLPIKKIDSTVDADKKNQYWNGYAGLGLNYEFGNNWNIRTSYTFEKDFSNSKKDFGDTGLDKVWQVGLNYRF